MGVVRVNLGGVEVTSPPYTEGALELAEMAAKRLIEGEERPVNVRLDTLDGDRLEVTLTQEDRSDIEIDVAVNVVIQ